MIMKKFTIFVLDDDKTFCSLLLCLAEKGEFVHAFIGYELSLSVFNNMANLDGAVEHIKKNKPDLVLLDYFLGPGGCVASLDVLKEVILCCAGQTDVKLITGMLPRDTRLEPAKEAVARMDMGIIQKPFSIDDLLEVIRISIKKKRKWNI